jgi:hypothetical protein
VHSESPQRLNVLFYHPRAELYQSRSARLLTDLVFLHQAVTERAQFLNQVRATTTRWDIVVVDSGLLTADGLDDVRELVSSQPHVIVGLEYSGGEPPGLEGLPERNVVWFAAPDDIDAWLAFMYKLLATATDPHRQL